MSSHREHCDPACGALPGSSYATGVCRAMLVSTWRPAIQSKQRWGSNGDSSEPDHILHVDAGMACNSSGGKRELAESRKKKTKAKPRCKSTHLLMQASCSGVEGGGIEAGGVEMDAKQQRKQKLARIAASLSCSCTERQLRALEHVDADLSLRGGRGRGRGNGRGRGREAAQEAEAGEESSEPELEEGADPRQRLAHKPPKRGSRKRKQLGSYVEPQAAEPGEPGEEAAQPEPSPEPSGSE